MYHRLIIVCAIVFYSYGGWCTPTLHLFDNQSTAEPFGKIEGPCCFGGWSDMCFSFKFFTSYFKSPKKTGDVALITKKKPSSAADAVVQLFTDASVFTINFNESARLTASQKTSVLAGQLLADYMW